MMHLYGIAPRSEAGAILTFTHVEWQPLADFACDVAPETTLDCEDWHDNEGDGLDDAGSAALAGALQAEIESGRAAGYIFAPPMPEGYALSVERLARLVAFLRDCGGFEIH